ncbi:dual specificity protein phosphatase 14 [Denticeps clupeoides]|uniref:dual specificity protein phosphatase 14 n=1 Tax=Denticeps clupeoides TaxID=299321 RepID=UPI0010A3B48E|nr:dual specificity protein phosphatase 14-like [Denticeps clupeoides]XP_028857544.1 dual specificity protein phosphatase 14-like [Denticeps clupeoides]
MAISQITPTLYLSGVDAAHTPAAIRSRRITLIVNATVEHECPEYSGVECLWVPVTDQPHAQIGQHFEEVADRISANRTGSTLVHCSAGRSRSPALVMAYLMKFHGVSLLDAHSWVLGVRPFVRPNAGFWRQLLEYERKLYGKNTVRMVATSAGVLPEAIDSPGGAGYCLNV